MERVRTATPRVAFEAALAAVDAAEYVRLRREIARFHPHLLYKRHSRFDTGALAAARSLNVPSVLEVNALFTVPPYHAFEPLALSGLARRFERRALELASIVAVSTPLQHQITRIVPQGNVLILPNGADPQRFDPGLFDGRRIRAMHGIGRALTIGWTGVLREWHGLGFLLDALAAIPDAMLLIVGDGPDRPSVNARAEQLGLSSRVIITGRIPHRLIPEYIAAMDIAVVPEERTGVASPMKLLEYMSMARAIAAPSAENIRDVIDDGVNGLLFRPGDAEDFTQSLRRLAEDATLRTSLGAHARAKIQTQRNWRGIATRVLACLRDVVSVPTSRSGARSSGVA